MAFDFYLKGLFFFLVVGMASTALAALGAVVGAVWFVTHHVAIY